MKRKTGTSGRLCLKGVITDSEEHLRIQKASNAIKYFFHQFCDL